MKPYCYLTAALLMMGTAMAQDPQRPGANPQNPPANPPAAAETQRNTTTTTGTATNTQTDMKMQSYKGTLVDASCAMGGAATSTTPGSPSSTASSTTSSTETSSNADRNATPQSSETHKSKHHKGEANRTEGASQACSVSGNTSQFALKLDDGRTVKFDSVGNLRAQDALKSKKWQDASSSGKPIQAKVQGAMLEDKLLVVSIH